MSKKVLTGVVISNKMQKSIVIRIEQTIMHPIYKKFFKRHKKFMAHDEQEVAKIGDVVKIIESKPLSKNKKWVLLDVVKKAEELPLDIPGEKIS
ncbi:MAG TPA: 30S ribosomal protein S17 [Spirochaetia bacterium]|nr:MAG: 30S ribosomal protein S17 [Spirochaetes bacterium GWB1_36_13]HCL57331.1 30S ribosomal protein S17 [Spirochaetia bacterium]